MSGRSESRTHKAHRSAVFETAAIAHWLALPLVSCGDRNRTCAGALNRRLPVPTRAPPQFESAQLDLNQRSPVPETGGIARLSYTPNARAPSGSRTRTSAMARRPTGVLPVGARCRYIMGACFVTNSIVKELRAPGRTRTDVAALRVRNLRR